MEKYFTVSIEGGRSVRVSCHTTLLEACRNAGAALDAPCGGHGKCGKCKVFIKERSDEALACQTTVYSDMTVIIPQRTEGHRILMEGLERSVRVEPELPCIPKEGGALVAFDIGTTTLASYLLDAHDGHVFSQSSMLNPQSQFGADVISRCNYELEHRDGALRESVTEGMINLMYEMLEASAPVRWGCNTLRKMKMDDICGISFAGNTCMHHLFLGFPTDHLVVAPYRAFETEELEIDACKAGFNIHNGALLRVLPNIGGFVGADTTACILASEFDKRDSLTLMIDIGTNGELVIGNKEGMISCSTAAGPAFEGAKISCGMRGASGAIDHVKMGPDGKIRCSVVGGGEAIGICGSGLLDAAAVFLREGIMDETGRMDTDMCSKSFSAGAMYSVQKGDDISATSIAREQSILRQGSRLGPGYLLSDGVVLFQKDIRELQLAKAAIAAGIKIICQKYGAEIEDIDEVLLAGAFGNFMDPNSACAIGLIPRELEKKIVPVGNMAAEGAKLAILSGREFRRAQDLASKASYLELASVKEFQEIYVDELLF